MFSVDQKREREEKKYVGKHLKDREISHSGICIIVLTFIHQFGGFQSMVLEHLGNP